MASLSQVCRSLLVQRRSLRPQRDLGTLGHVIVQRPEGHRDFQAER